MKKKIYMAFLMSLAIGALTGCGQNVKTSESTVQSENARGENMGKDHIEPDTKIQVLEEGLSVVRFEGSKPIRMQHPVCKKFRRGKPLWKKL